jgi:hypothetical protein
MGFSNEKGGEKTIISKQNAGLLFALGQTEGRPAHLCGGFLRTTLV